MIWYFQDEILAHQQQYRAVFTSPEEEFWGTHQSSSHWKLWSANLYSTVSPSCWWTSEKWTQDHKQLYASDQLHLLHHSYCTVLVSTTMLNPVHERAFIYDMGLLTQPLYTNIVVSAQLEAQQSSGTDTLAPRTLCTGALHVLIATIIRAQPQPLLLSQEQMLSICFPINT